MDWNTVLGAAAGFLLVYGLAGTIYLTVAWLRSRRKRPGPRPSKDIMEDWIGGYRQGWEAAKNVYDPPMDKPWKPSSPPLSEATGTSEAAPPGSDAG